jgi:hypothetical protein
VRRAKIVAPILTMVAAVVVLSVPGVPKFFEFPDRDFRNCTTCNDRYLAASPVLDLV